jgi:phosphopantothenoylcysteine synthetase/decarboxylase
MKIALAQINPTVGDIPGNLRRIRAWISRAEKKRADLIAANDITERGSGFASSQNRITLIRRTAPDRPVALPLMDKSAVARHILGEVAALLAG